MPISQNIPASLMPTWNFTWIDADGNKYPLQLPPKYTVIYQSLVGAYAPPFAPVVEYRPLTPGTYLKYVNTDAREVELIMLVQGINPQELWNNMSGWPYIFSPLRPSAAVGPAAPPYPYLQVTTPSGTTRNLACICISDFTLNPASYYEQSVQVPLRFYASNPYFFDVTGQVFIFNPFTHFPRTFLPLFPLKLVANATIGSNFNIPNGNLYPVGDVDTYPTWIIEGPLSSIGLTNTTTNQTFSMSFFNNPLVTGETLTIDMNKKTVIRNLGKPTESNMLSYVNITSQFWPLIPSGNNISTSFSIVAGAPQNTRIGLIWYPQRMGVV